jgi:hypothetical protein
MSLFQLIRRVTNSPRTEDLGTCAMRRIAHSACAAFFLLVGLRAFAQFANRPKEIYFDVTGRNIGTTTIGGARISFSDFQFQWGYLEPYASKTYSDHVLRIIPEKALLGWITYTGMTKASEVSIPPLPARFTGEGSKLVDGRYRGEGLLLRFDIEPEAGTVCAVWTDNAFPSNNVRCK